MMPEQRDFFHWLSALIALPAAAYSGQPFFRSAFRALRARSTNMDVPISIGIVLALAMSVVETIHHAEHAYFDAALMLITFLVAGRYLDQSMLPSEASDFSNPEFAAVIDKTQRSSVASPTERVKLFKLVWDAIGSEFGSRHLQYEMFYSGPTFVTRGHSFRFYDWDGAKALVDGFMLAPIKT